MLRLCACSVVVLLITGCSPAPDAVGTGGTKWRSDVTVITLKDGTKCAVLEGIGRGGIDCDWGQ